MQSPVPHREDSIALLCRRCAHTLCRSRTIPSLSIAKGYDYGSLERCGLPELSLLEMMLVRRIMPYGHIVKLVDGESHYALAGHLVAIPTEAADRIADASVAQMHLPRRDVANFVSVVFVGQCDRWERLMTATPDQPSFLGNTYGQIFRGLLFVSSIH